MFDPRPITRTVEELAADPDFRPEATGIPMMDKKPYGWHTKHREAVRRDTACLVLGCRVAYAPGGVCGYCRGRVNLLRKSGRATGLAGAA